jgi:hypothetical protein
MKLYADKKKIERQFSIGVWGLLETKIVSIGVDIEKRQYQARF